MTMTIIIMIQKVVIVKVNNNKNQMMKIIIITNLLLQLHQMISKIKSKMLLGIWRAMMERKQITTTTTTIANKSNKNKKENSKIVSIFPTEKIKKQLAKFFF